ncbi:MAG TPA: right-handed parallel beta-helix repeat-containing protein [Noviherbaspirillum sp.]|uniref:right-handed parallel beta-helix repeat-containing protein n=1 Tax=Noviherbaspirillum sp. TaxID=1926288 RepID=UPI002DDCC7BC|nr:right-handed parallel beta-helix repeat-containing protein [Noviherbaspirillum sp.]HEV2610329.1 right-handed parallel beta-helix repeat-containing protein [Noviherbaspirillum sp.]
MDSDPASSPSPESMAALTADSDASTSQESNEDPTSTRTLATTTAVTTGTHLYVATTGSDSNPGTATAPFKTILKASKVAKPGTTVHVAPGSYPAGFSTTTSGTTTARIRYVSDVKWGAKLVPAANTTSRIAWSVHGSNIDVEGFEVDGRSNPSWRIGLTTRGSNVVFKNNHVHHIATNVPCESNGAAGISNTHYYYGVNVQILGNVVHHIGYTGCQYYQGIYHQTTGAIKNNVVYKIGKTAIQLWHDANNTVIANNTVFSSDVGIKVGGGGFYHNAINDYTHVSNNIVFDNVDGIREVGVTGTHNTYTNNLVFRNSNISVHLKNGNTHSGTIKADPQFVNYIRDGGGDYRLKSTSPAVNKGSATYAPPTDIVGTPRPQGGVDDLGAYEYK